MLDHRGVARHLRANIHKDSKLVTDTAQDKMHDENEQSKRFIDTAKEAGADETDEGEDGALKKVISKSRPKTGNHQD